MLRRRSRCPARHLVVTALLAVLPTVLLVAAPVRAVPALPFPSPVAAGVSDPVPVHGWVWPLDPRPALVHGFDPPEHPYGAGHRGVDLAGTPGQRVLAVDAGTVSFAGSVAGRGVVVVDHGALRTTYEPVLRLVARGDEVARGQVLGALTSVGGHCVPTTCLHLGVRRGDTYLDPLLFLPPLPVRLLPRT